MKNSINKLLSSAGAYLARPTADWHTYARKQISFNILILAALLSTATVGFWDPISSYLSETFSAKPTLSTPSPRWFVAFSQVSNCSKLSYCKAAGEISSIWKSSLRLSDKNHFAEVRKPENRIFWVGLNLLEPDLKAARETGANVLVVGYLNAAFRLFVNGELRSEGDGRDYLPISVILSPGDLDNSKGIFVTLEVTQTLGSARPIVVDAPYVNGLFTQTDFRNLRDFYIYELIIRPLALGLAAILSALAFLSLWLSVRDRNEYFLFAIYTLCLFAVQIMSWGSIKHTMDRGAWYQLDMTLRVLEGLSAALVGISYARLRVGAYLWIFFYGAMVTLLMHRSSSIGSDFLYLSQYIGIYFVPSCFALGALACITQASFGKRQGFSRMSNRKQKLRVERLVSFATLNAALAFAYFIGAQKIVTIAASAFWYRPVQYLLVALTGFFLFRDFREFDFTQQKVASSKFHDPLAKEQQVIRGYLLAMDLKKSSRLYDLSARLGLATKIPTLWCESATEIVEGLGGSKISSAGDSLIAFFEGEDLQVFENTLDALKKISAIGHEYQQYGGIACFRAGVINAGIRPIYKKVFRKMYEDFEDGPGEASFKNLMRILDTEKLHGFGEKSVLVLESITALEIASHLPLLKREKLLVRDVGTKELFYLDLDVASQNEAKDLVA